MKPINQTRFHDPTNQSPPGNCWTACLASILEKSIKELPDEKEFWVPGSPPSVTWPPYEKRMYEYLATLGLSYLEASVRKVSRDLIGDVYCVIVGPSPRDKRILHSVVGRGNNIVHDPHPSNVGLAGEENDWDWGYLIKTFV